MVAELHQVAPDANLICVLVVHVHDQEGSHDRAEKTTDVGQSVSDFLEGASDRQRETRLAQVERQVLGGGDVHEGLGLLVDDPPCVYCDLGVGEEALVGVDFEGRDEDVGRDAEGRGEGEVVPVLEVVPEVVRVLRVQDGVHVVVVESEGGVRGHIV